MPASLPLLRSSLTRFPSQKILIPLSKPSAFTPSSTSLYYSVGACAAGLLWNWAVQPQESYRRYTHLEARCITAVSPADWQFEEERQYEASRLAFVSRL